MLLVVFQNCFNDFFDVNEKRTQIKIIFGDGEISLLEEFLQTVVDRLQCSQMYIHIGQLTTLNCHCIKSTSMEDIEQS